MLINKMLRNIIKITCIHCKMEEEIEEDIYLHPNYIPLCVDCYSNYFERYNRKELCQN